MEPESLHQPRIEGLPAEYPALKTLENGPTNLPVIRDATIGRERELREISALLGDEGVRVLTLTRPGGTGKTRLALQAAADLVEDCADGVFLVRLASISDPRLVLSAIAQSLAVREVADEDPACTLAAHLGQKRMLLVVDNFEQVLEAADGVSGLVAQCPGLRLLVTSRERLRVGGERVFAVPPLQLPGVDEPVQAIAASEAVALFVSRAEAATSSFAPTERDLPTIAEVCRMLDGLPLAIELAAARAPVLSPEALLRRLDRRLQFLTSGARDAEARQRTLRATIE